MRSSTPTWSTVGERLRSGSEFIDDDDDGDDEDDDEFEAIMRKLFPRENARPPILAE